MFKRSRKRLGKKIMIKRVVVMILVVVGVGSLMIPYHALRTYQKKRNFATTPEPSGEGVKKTHKRAIFVVQKHDASHLHYDFRLEMRGALKSWAVPKGPSTDPKDKRLAVETEDHPLEYAKFEGIIPEGNYGAGTVEIWDHGIFENSKYEDGKLVPLSRCYKDGHIEIFLHGKKMYGNYALIRMKDSKRNWLLVKMHDTEDKVKKSPKKRKVSV
jgi:DNA ligase D-like protein (predicted 3'-phosphoesterase)